MARRICSGQPGSLENKNVHISTHFLQIMRLGRKVEKTAISAELFGILPENIAILVKYNVLATSAKCLKKPEVFLDYLRFLQK